MGRHKIGRFNDPGLTWPDMRDRVLEPVRSELEEFYHMRVSSKDFQQFKIAQERLKYIEYAIKRCEHIDETHGVQIIDNKPWWWGPSSDE